MKKHKGNQNRAVIPPEVSHSGFALQSFSRSANKILRKTLGCVAAFLRAADISPTHRAEVYAFSEPDLVKSMR